MKAWVHAGLAALNRIVQRSERKGAAMRISMLLALTVLGLGCGNMRASMYYPELDRVRVFDSAPNEPFEVIGNVAGTDEYLHDLVRDLKIKAVKLGGDALLITYRVVAPPSGDEHQRINIAADVIRFKREVAK